MAFAGGESDGQWGESDGQWAEQPFALAVTEATAGVAFLTEALLLGAQSEM